MVIYLSTRWNCSHFLTFSQYLIHLFIYLFNNVRESLIHPQIDSETWEVDRRGVGKGLGSKTMYGKMRNKDQVKKI